MKKVIVSALGLAMVCGAASTAFAVENQFGGYWRTRAIYDDQFSQDGESTFFVDNRTRLYYTAKFNDDFKFVNKFEFNSTWGDNNGGDLGADGMGSYRIKNSYADFNLGNVNTKLGITSAVIARGFIFDSDFSGILVTPKFGNNALTLGYVSISNSDLADDADIEGSDAGEALAILSLKPSDTLSITPYLVYGYIQDNTLVEASYDDADNVVTEAVYGDTELYYAGVDFDVQADAISLWSTLIYNGGQLSDDVDVSAFLGAFGLDAGVAHGAAVYSTGDDNSNDDEMNAFVPAPGASFYWAEIMGYGMFDNASPLDGRSVGHGVSVTADGISDVIALNAGVTFKPADKLTLSGDVWYAALAEENANGDSYVGTELDGKLSYTVMDNMTLDGVVAYLIAGDVLTEDVTEVGARLSLKF